MKSKQSVSVLQSIRYWMGVAVIGVVVGVSLQFAQAWTNPTVAPPNGNVGGPINTSGFTQFKSGALGIGQLLTAFRGIDVGKYDAAGNLIGQNKITNVETPTDPNDAVNKAYVDGALKIQVAASTWFKVNCDGNLNFVGRADCANGTRPINCLYDIKGNGKMESGNEYWPQMHDSQTALSKWSQPLEDRYERFQTEMIPPGQKSRVDGNPMPNGGCSMFYSCSSPTNQFSGATARTRAVCLSTTNFVIDNPNE